ncbi:MAG: FAD-dependent oxidoreductase [Verrucomicrobia bacterium]|nr:FAD-dependent oxidoreductase [Verrucomicrobiota bacterium]
MKANLCSLRLAWRVMLTAWLVLPGMAGVDAARAAGRSDVLFLEAEQFQNLGGWVVDQQFMDQMGSPYLLAHGLGEPVGDAATSVMVEKAGRARLWVRTRDWVAPWKVKGTPGRFQVLINGKPLKPLFGTEGEEWHWQDGGMVRLQGKVSVALHDLTGFEGRCDAVLFSFDPGFRPPDGGAALAGFRRQALGLPEHPSEAGSYDLVVVGGGIAGTAAAVTAARLGLKVALVQDRPVLGGNGSSEVRVWPQGKVQQQPYPHIGDVVAEMVMDKDPRTGNGKDGRNYDDDIKLALARAEPNLKLFLEHRVNGVETNGGRIVAVVAQEVCSARRVRLEGQCFLDSTGDACVGALAGADHEITKEQHMGASNLWGVEDTGKPQFFPVCECKDTNALNWEAAASTTAAPFPLCPWAVDLRDKSFPGRKNMNGQWPDGGGLGNLGAWFWESGFDRDPIDDVERMRDLNLRAMYGAWDVLKNVDRLYPTHRLRWAAYIAGKRESRRLLGDVILTGDDFRTGHVFEDACFPCSWHIDLHSPSPAFQKGHEGEEFISLATTGTNFNYKSPYWAPYRSLYSRNISNLFMAGRDISVTHEALGAVRVMRTCGAMGEVVGMAASLCKQHKCTPREVYQKHLPELQALMKRGASRQKIPVD